MPDTRFTARMRLEDESAMYRVLPSALTATSRGEASPALVAWSKENRSGHSTWANLPTQACGGGAAVCSPCGQPLESLVTYLNVIAGKSRDTCAGDSCDD